MPSLSNLDPVFVSVALLCVIIVGVSKSGLGGGLGQLNVPILIIFISPLEAVALMLPILCVIDLFNVWGYRKYVRKDYLLIMVPGAVLGVAIGGLTFKYVDDSLIRLLLGGLSLFFAFSYFRQKKAVKVEGRKAVIFGGLCGTLSGFTSTVAHAGGGPIKMFLLPQRLDKRIFVGTQVYFFFIVNQLKIWPYFWLGQMTTETLSLSLILLPAVPIGMWMGYKLIDIVRPEVFYKIVYFVLFVAGCKLIYDGLSGLGYI